jgi:hypothetical protein
MRGSFNCNNRLNHETQPHRTRCFLGRLPGARRECSARTGAKAREALELPDVDVIGVTPAVTSGLSRDKVSGNIQTAQVEPVRLSKARTAVLGAKRNPVDAGLVVCDNEDINRGHP